MTLESSCLKTMNIFCVKSRLRQYKEHNCSSEYINITDLIQGFSTYCGTVLWGGLNVRSLRMSCPNYILGFGSHVVDLIVLGRGFPACTAILYYTSI